MKFYRNPSNDQVFGYDTDGTQDDLIAAAVESGWVDVTSSWPPSPTTQELKLRLQGAAQAALDKSDITVLRCVTAGISVPSDWQTYREAMRAIVNGSDASSTSLPSIPAYPPAT